MKHLLEPTSNNIILKPYERPDFWDEGELIAIPDAYKRDESGWLWEVVAVGPGRVSRKGVLLPCECKPGDIVEVEQRFALQSLDQWQEGHYNTPEDNVAYIVWRASDD